MRTIIVLGPQRCGKTYNARRLAAYFGCELIVDDWDPRLHDLQPGAVHLTNVPGPYPRTPGVRHELYNYVGIGSMAAESKTARFTGAMKKRRYRGGPA